ncbi:MaoC family dehydratase [Carboxylicivirga linearis]|uniref:MaoC family dehydratase N-terminal domain-containing protein n=1 Tax=Carboxylicivirga linearis TaxID=1628157 RepID=A0ABS5JT53_9BACT|nr:MaoC family dehydratase N-terminal domain-containing protein [Carboxylicivirga linearis]MBS2098059.1 MaoC family dehydratase N-terminal domain-containing protein [Carboxylicivirga linearis]
MQDYIRPNKKVNYGLDLSKVAVGQEIISQFNITVDESIHSLWSGFMPTSSYTENSREFAGILGFHELFLPYGFLLNLTLSLGVEDFAHSSLLHLEIRNALYLNPAFAGDTLTCEITIKSVQPTSNNRYSIIVSEHVLSNQKGEPVFSLDRVTLFPFIEGCGSGIEGKSNFKNHHFKEKILARVRGIELRNKISDFEHGDLLLHPFVRPVGKSENLYWATYFKNTHPIHYNYQRYKPGEIVVSGGIVVSMVLSIASREFRQLLSPEIVRAFHVVPVVAEDRIGAFSFVKEVVQLMPGFEELVLLTFGVRNIDTEMDLGDISFPKELFDDVQRPSEVEKILEEKCPSLHGIICCVAEWKVLRKVE